MKKRQNQADKLPSTRFENPWFSVSGKYSDEAAANFDRIFGMPESKFCDTCGRIEYWCECEGCDCKCTEPGGCKSPDSDK